MRIGIYTNSYHPAIHGVVRSIDIFRRELTALGHEVYIFCPADETFEDNDPYVLRYPSLANYADMDCRISVPRSLTMDRAVRDLKLDIIHSQHPIYIGYEASRQAKRCGIPLVFTYHSQYDTVLRIYLDWPNSIFRRVMRRLYYRYFNLSDCIITPTESIRSMVAVKMPLHAHLLKVLPTPMDMDAFSELIPGPIRERYHLAGTTTFVNVSRLGPEKNLDKLIEAFALAAVGRPQLRLLIVGDGPMRMDLTHLINRHKLENQVFLTGMVPMSEVGNYLAAGDAYVCASLTETQGLALLEAMAAGLPVAAMNAPGSCDFIDNEQNGLLTPCTAPALAQAIERLADDVQLRAHLSSKVKAVVARYDPVSVTSRLVEIYQQTIVDYQSKIAGLGRQVTDRLSVGDIAPQPDH
ncbi:MAG: glycosyltransferase [Chloroflexi bacterium]|nr:glycosyltransferase [Chloroflexota bacterium]